MNYVLNHLHSATRTVSVSVVLPRVTLALLGPFEFPAKAKFRPWLPDVAAAAERGTTTPAEEGVTAMVRRVAAMAVGE